MLVSPISLRQPRYQASALTSANGLLVVAGGRNRRCVAVLNALTLTLQLLRQLCAQFHRVVRCPHAVNVALPNAVTGSIWNGRCCIWKHSRVLRRLLGVRDPLTDRSNHRCVVSGAWLTNLCSLSLASNLVEVFLLQTQTSWLAPVGTLSKSRALHAMAYLASTDQMLSWGG